MCHIGCVLEVREQSTLDLYVIRTAGALGAMLPFDQLRRQSQQLMDGANLSFPLFLDLISCVERNNVCIHGICIDTEIFTIQ